MGEAARRRAETLLSLERQLDRFEEVYEELLQAGNAGGPQSASAARTAAQVERTATILAELEELDARRQELERRLWRREVVDAVHAFASERVPAGAEILIVSRGDDHLVHLGSRRAAHFPQADDGGYAGHHPADSGEAIAHLEELRRRGAQYLIVPATSGWWLDYYEELTAHLDREHTRMEGTGEHLTVFALSASPAAVPVP
jgi:hypothetical protein